MKKKILVTGGAGFIGSQVNWMLNQGGYETVVVDNLIRGDKRAVVKGKLIESGLHDSSFLTKIMKEEKVDAVMHFAAFTDVGESVQNPSLYYENNVISTVKLLEAMQNAAVKHLVFSSSAAVYGIPKEEKLLENSPLQPINPYGETKMVCENTISDFGKAYGIEHTSLRYFNAAGGDPNGKLKSYKEKEHNLIPLILNALLKNESVTVFGTNYDTPDGTCIRDYVHIADIGNAHILALEKLFSSTSSICYNLGNGLGYSVKEVIRTAEEVTGRKAQVIFGKKRAGDPPRLLSDATKAKTELGWRPQYSDLKTMIKDAWVAKK